MPIVQQLIDQKRPKEATPERILKLHEAGATWRAIGLMYGICGERARQLGKKALNMRRRKDGN